MTVPAPRFGLTRLRDGYDTAEVDATVGRVLAALEGRGPGVTRAEVQALRFTPVRVRQGYDMGDVDAWLDLVADELDRRGWASPTGPPMTPRAMTPGAWPPGAIPPPPPAVEVDPDLRVFDGRMAAIVLPLLALAALVAWLLVR